MYIIGAGLSGMLCNILNPGSKIFEASPEIKENHKAVLRLRSPEISRITGIPMKAVTVYKAVWSEGKEVVHPTIGQCHDYSYKVVGKKMMRSIFDLRPVKRWIPPEDFYLRLAELCDIEFDAPVAAVQKDNITFARDYSQSREGRPVVSTLPLNLNAILTLNDPIDLQSGEIHVYRSEIHDCDSYCTIYYPDINTPVYRASITGSTVIIEAIYDVTAADLQMVRDSFRIWFSATPGEMEHHIQKNGKIISAPSHDRKNLILRMTMEDDLYSLGRFATWREKVMMDDVLNDIYKIKELIAGHKYDAAKYSQED